MYSVIGERDFLKFYLVLFGFYFFFFIMSLMVGGIFIHDYQSDHFMSQEYALLAMVAALVVGATYITYRFFIITPSIVVDHDSIKLNRKTYYWTDLEKVELSGKRPYIFMNLKEGVLLKFKGQNEIYFLDMYENMATIGPKKKER